MEERELINECLKFNSSAQKKLYERYSRKLFAISIRYTKNRTEAEDILQESFVKIFKKLHMYQFSGSFDGWIKRIVINCALDHFRQKKEFLLSLSEIKEQEYAIDEEESCNHLREIPAEKLFEMINQLPIGFKAIFSMKAIDGFTHKEIAEKLGISDGTSKSSYSKARNKLKILLEQYYAREI